MVDFGEIAFFLNFKGHGGFIGLNLGDGISWLNFIAFFHEPFQDLAFFHRV